MSDPIQHNRQIWDQRAKAGMVFSRPATERELADPMPHLDTWARQAGVAGKRILCLGAGGGRQGILYAAGGGVVTVVDLSEDQLTIDRRMAVERGLQVRCVRTSMDDLAILDEASFDMIIQPVSSCYVPDVSRLWAGVARVLKPGGLYIGQHKQPASLQAHVTPAARGYEIIEPYVRSGPLPPVTGSAHREPGTLEFLHTWEALLGGLCRSGFVIEDVAEPDLGDPAARPGTFGHRSRYVPPYVRVKARRVGGPSQGPGPLPKIIC